MGFQRGSPLKQARPPRAEWPRLDGLRCVAERGPPHGRGGTGFDRLCVFDLARHAIWRTGRADGSGTRRDSQAAVLDRDAQVAHRQQPGLAGARLGRRVSHAELRPHRAGVDGDSVLHYLRQEC